MMMPPDELQRRLRACLRYRTAPPWQKPLIHPRRFWRNQFRKWGWQGGRASALGKADAFHLASFAIVPGESVSDEIVSYGFFEVDLTQVFLSLVQPGQMVLDI